MATTSIWAVKGWLGKVVLYIENPEKTENPQFYRQKNMTDVQVQNLSDVIDYAARLDKTTEALDSESVSVLRQLVSGINCLPATARDEMLAVKKRFGKEDGVVAYHGYQSFAPGEATPEMAHEIGVKLVRKLWGEKYQVLVATHLDKENHLHSHFVVNSVSLWMASATIVPGKTTTKCGQSPTNSAGNTACPWWRSPSRERQSTTGNGGPNRSSAPHGVA